LTTTYSGLRTEFESKIGEFNLQTLKVLVTFKLQPKTLTETTAVFLKFSEEKIPMEKQGTEFVLTKDFAIKDEVSPTITIILKWKQDRHL
jgi:hypothetical protein